MFENNPELSIVIISYNTRELTLKCIASIFEHTSCRFEVIVVDNASSDGSAVAISSQFPNIHVVAETVNHGFARAHDVAVPLARGEWLLLLNPDTVVLSGALDSLLEFAKKNADAGIWGGRTLYPDGSLNPYSCWGKMTLWSTFCRLTGLSALFRRSELFNSEEIGGWLRDSVREVDIVTGCLLLIKRSTWDELEGFQPIFTMYGEEADLCLRARKIGLAPMITPASTIVHYGGASETFIPDKIVRIMRAKIELTKRHFRQPASWIVRSMLRLWPLSRSFVYLTAGLLSQKRELIERGKQWSDVWRRRTEWKDGFGT